MNRRPGQGKWLASTTGLAALMFAAPSHAYLDPGTGSIILQSILAGIAVAIGFLRLYWHRFKSFLSSLTGGTPNVENQTEQNPAPQVDSGDQS
ncbi:MAG: hypothetical protein GTO71_04150 [Woeseiaceae bacterium]|nr:hypothetical protein [Woeseiaceae bacterium]NIP20291.1 hypothetical protein [Woeseiaceae bacterium]NIS89164.1 hypothetical protein [Woeseiaceae bacterium]